MPLIRPTIEPTADGSPTLRHPLLGDCYHSVRGALGEARHVFIGHGFRAACEKWREEGSSRPLCIFEAGFGSGLNAWLTLVEAETSQCPVEYHAAELYPVAPEVAAALGYTDDPRFMQLHAARWETHERISPLFMLKKQEKALERMEFNGIFDLVYYDAFAPDTQPELWSAELFGRIGRTMRPGGLLVTYSAKGTVKQALRAAGFEVHRLPGALGKRHMLRAVRL